MDERLVPYAEFVEGFLGALIQQQPSKIGVVLLCDKGSVTEFYGDVTGGDKAAMAYHMVSDAIMNEVYRNAASIVAEAEKQGGN